EMLCSWQIIFFDYSKRARLLNKSAKDTGSLSCLFFISVFLSVKLNNRKTIKILFLLSLAFGKLDKTDKIKIIKGLKVEIYQRSGLKNTTCPLIVFKLIRVQKPPCRGGRGRVFLFLFLRKKKKGLHY